MIAILSRRSSLKSKLSIGETLSNPHEDKSTTAQPLCRPAKNVVPHQGRTKQWPSFRWIQIRRSKQQGPDRSLLTKSKQKCVRFYRVVRPRRPALPAEHIRSRHQPKASRPPRRVGCNDYRLIFPSPLINHERPPSFPRRFCPLGFLRSFVSWTWDKPAVYSGWTAEIAFPTVSASFVPFQTSRRAICWSPCVPELCAIRCVQVDCRRIPILTC